jgi:hypothetical protein
VEYSSIKGCVCSGAYEYFKLHKDKLISFKSDNSSKLYFYNYIQGDPENDIQNIFCTHIIGYRYKDKFCNVPFYQKIKPGMWIPVYVTDGNETYLTFAITSKSRDGQYKFALWSTEYYYKNKELEKNIEVTMYENNKYIELTTKYIQSFCAPNKYFEKGILVHFGNNSVQYLTDMEDFLLEYI